MTTPYTIRRVRSRSIRIHVHGDGRVVVTAPRQVSEKTITKFVDEKQEWIDEHVRKIASKPRRLLSYHDAEEYKRLRPKAMAFAARRLQHFNIQYGTTYRRLQIRDSTTRWGSCSRTGSISFSYKIVLLPPALADYIVVHELCHCLAFNHSLKFWELVAEAIPDYKECRKLLRNI